MVFQNSPQSDLAGTLDWIKPAQPPGAYYPASFSVSVDLIAAKYAPLAINSTTASLIFSATNLDGSPIAEPLNISPSGKVTIDRANNDANVSLAVFPATGLFSGTVLLPVSRKEASFGGVIYQKPAPAGFGLFMDTGACGTVEIAP
jgi:hypothetical protein